MKLEVTYRGTLTVEPEYSGETFDRDEVVEGVFTLAMRDLVDQGVEDPSVSGSIAQGTVEISVTVEAPTRNEALARADAAVRAALHAAGACTDEWVATPGDVRVVGHESWIIRVDFSETSLDRLLPT